MHRPVASDNVPQFARTNHHVMRCVCSTSEFNALHEKNEAHHFGSPQIGRPLTISLFFFRLRNQNKWPLISPQLGTSKRKIGERNGPTTERAYKIQHPERTYAPCTKVLIRDNDGPCYTYVYIIIIIIRRASRFFIIYHVSLPSGHSFFSSYFSSDCNLMGNRERKALRCM